MIAAGASPRATSVAEPLLTYAVVTALASALFWIGHAVAWVNANLHGAIAFLFLVAPAVGARISRHPFDYDAAGLRLDPVRLGLRVLVQAIALTWPSFLLGFVVYYGLLCSTVMVSAGPQWLDWLVPQCARFVGLAQARLPFGEGGDSGFDVLMTFATQLLVVAIPEELFFRGYLQGRFDKRWAPRTRLLGANVGPGWLLAAALFALGHVLVDLNPQRLAVFVPGLIFGWMRARTGALAAGALFHALCNVYSSLLHRAFFV